MSKNLRRMNVAKRAQNITPNKTVFAGDPVTIPAETAGEVLTQEVLPEDLTATAVAESGPEAQAAEKVAALDAMTVEEKARITLVPPLAVSNANVIVNPVTKGLSAANLNFQLEQMLMIYPIEGFVKTVSGAGPESETILKFDGSELNTPSGQISGVNAFAFLRINISASTLNARSGANYSIFMRFRKPDKQGSYVETPAYTIQRLSNTQPILGVYVPFENIATRTLAALAAFGTEEEGEAPIEAELVVKGMQPEEVLTATVPGYATGELRKIAESYNLPAGIVD